jgi:hypothetical protein
VLAKKRIEKHERRQQMARNKNRYNWMSVINKHVVATIACRQSLSWTAAELQDDEEAV